MISFSYFIRSYIFILFFFLIIPLPPRSTRTYTLFPCTTLFRSKTGTPPRIDGRTIDYSALEEQPGDLNPVPVFSFLGNAAMHPRQLPRSEEHTSELQSLMRISYAVFCLKNKNTNTQIDNNTSRRTHNIY